MEQWLNEHPVQLVLVANVDLLELETVGLCDRSQIFQIAGIGELVDHAHGIRCVVDDVPGNSRPDESGAPGNDDAVHESECSLWQCLGCSAQNNGFFLLEEKVIIFPVESLRIGMNHAMALHQAAGY